LGWKDLGFMGSEFYETPHIDNLTGEGTVVTIAESLKQNGYVIAYMRKWKLHEYFKDGDLELYNLNEDTGETHNMIAKYPEKAKELHERLNSWREELESPVPTHLNPGYDEEYDRAQRRK